MKHVFYIPAKTHKEGPFKIITLLERPQDNLHFTYFHIVMRHEEASEGIGTDDVGTGTSATSQKRNLLEHEDFLTDVYKQFVRIAFLGPLVEFSFVVVSVGLQNPENGQTD